MDCSANLPLKKATNKDLWILKIKFIQKKRILSKMIFFTKTSSKNVMFKKFVKEKRYIKIKDQIKITRAIIVE